MRLPRRDHSAGGSGYCRNITATQRYLPPVVPKRLHVLLLLDQEMQRIDLLSEAAAPAGGAIADGRVVCLSKMTEVIMSGCCLHDGVCKDLLGIMNARLRASNDHPEEQQRLAILLYV